MITKIAFIITTLFILPLFSFANTEMFKREWQTFVLPSGMHYLAEILIPTAKADDTPLVDIIRTYILAMATKYKADPITSMLIANCESGFLDDAEKALTIKGDYSSTTKKYMSYGLYQWWEKSWNYYNQLYGTKLNRENWMDQVVMSNRVIGDKGYKDWTNCYTYVITGKWPWKIGGESGSKNDRENLSAKEVGKT